MIVGDKIYKNQRERYLGDYKESFREVLLLVMDALDEKRINGFNMSRSVVGTPIFTVNHGEHSSGTLNIYYDQPERAKEELSKLSEVKSYIYINTFDDFMMVPDGTEVRIFNGETVKIPAKGIRTTKEFLFYKKGVYREEL